MGYKRYSIYRIKDDFPVAIFQPAQYCADLLGISVDTFRSYFSRQRHGVYARGVRIYGDDTSDIEEHEIVRRRPYKTKKVLKPVSYSVIRLRLEGMTPKQIANALCISRSAIHYHEQKIISFYGYVPWEQRGEKTLLLEEAKSIDKKTVGKQVRGK